MKKFDFNGQKNICGGQIRMLRLCRHMSQVTLAIKMQTEGVTMEQDVVSRIESGARLMTDYELRAFAAVLDVPLESLFPPETK
ncbi:helix-turn-helix transcriptional regulator [Lawsonibacter celer]|uniref:helix-turn-helix transcriptional regulator n=1 Tax=Lawsonibacter celer TaxID=2986526 RepID=UPI0016463BC3|nr:helix-turn-helix transcriptional regulator [Lawsonibacter celer]